VRDRRELTRNVACSAVWLGLLATTFPLSAQTMPPPSTPVPAQNQDANGFTLKVYSRLTVVDVTVVDSKENPVHGLPESAFTILEDGKPQPIRSFTEVGKEPPPVTRTSIRTCNPHRLRMR
jgi:hypothetical protein